MTSPLLLISDGTTTIDLLEDPYGIEGWTPQVADLKDAGVWQSSPLADGRQMAFYRYGNIIETMELRVQSAGQDSTIDPLRKLRNLLDAARDYWTSPLSISPVYIIARGDHETNTRYAVINDYRIPEDDDPYTTPFSDYNQSAMDLTLLLEHGFWQAEVPGSDSCLLSGFSDSTWTVWAHTYNSTPNAPGEGTYSADNGFDDLPASYDLTFEFWVERTSANGYVLTKTGGGATGWSIFVGNTISVFADYGTNATATSSTTVGTGLHHIACTLALATKTWRIFLDGTEVAYASNTAGVGAYVTDAAYNLGLGDFGAFAYSGTPFDEPIGPIRISKTLRYAGAFTPPGIGDSFGVDSNSIMVTHGYLNFIAKTVAAPAITATGWTTGSEAEFDPYNSEDREYTGCDLSAIMGAPGGFDNVPTEFIIMYYYDASLGGGTYLPIGSFPFTCPVYAAGDYLFIFSPYPLWSYMFDTGGTFSVTSVSYWNGAWTAFNYLDSPGGLSSRFQISRGNEYPGEVTQALTGVTGYYYRLSMTHVGGTITQAPIAPQYKTPVIQSSGLPGDMSALLRLWGNSFQDPAYDVKRVVLATRSVNRGTFSPVWVDGSNLPVPDLEYQTGITTINLAGGASNVGNNLTNSELDSTTLISGKYRGFLRCWIDTGRTLGDMLVSVYVGFSSIEKYLLLNEPVPVGDYSFIDIGLVDLTYLRDDYYQPSFASNIDYDIFNTTGVALDFHLVDLVLIPADELMVSLSNTDDQSQIWSFDINPTEFPKIRRTALAYSGAWDSIPIPYNSIPQMSSSIVPQISKKANSYVYGISFSLESAGTVWRSRGQQSFRFATRSVSRYHSMRGDS